jgi:sporulation protein YlmC with PRC-barrel domain
MDTRHEENTHLPVEGFERRDWDTVTVEQIRDATIYDRRDQRVADVDDVVLDEDGRIATVVMDVGGFLGIGSRSVAIPTERLSVQERIDGDEHRLYVNMTEDELRQQPVYTGVAAPVVTRWPGTT